MINHAIKNRHCAAFIVTLLISSTIYTVPFMYVADEQDTVTVIDGTTNEIVTAISVPPLTVTSTPTPFCIAIAPNGTTACAGVNQFDSNTSTYASTIALINASLSVPILTKTATLIASSPNSISTTCVAYTTDSNTVYVGVSTGTSPSLIFPVTNVAGSPIVGTSIPVPDATSSPTDIAIANTSNGETAYFITDAADMYYMQIPGNTPVALDTTGITSNLLASLVIAPDAQTAYAIGTDFTNGLIYTIDTSTNIITNLLSPITIPGETGPSGITTDGTYLYVTGAGSRNLYIIPINNPGAITTISLSAIGQPNCLTITPNGKSVYIAYKAGDVNSYPVPAGSPAGETISTVGSIASNSIASFSQSTHPPASVSGCKTQNTFLLQTDFINHITWTAPASGLTPVKYKLYRDAALMQPLATIPATGPLEYYDHDRNPNLTYSYYIVSIDASGSRSTPISITVTQNC